MPGQIPLDQRVAAARDYGKRHGCAGTAEDVIRLHGEQSDKPRHESKFHWEALWLILRGEVVPVEGEGTRP